jgi:2-succinyl-5-enolpyruvyl-6-hydroxy-3-cyclohexene-1-carboxylate synthase
VANEIVNGLGCITQPDFDIEFLAQWQAASALTQSVLSKEKNLQPDQMNEPNFARVLVKALPSKVNIFIGASRPARDMEAMAGKRSDIRLFHNRGLAGIDGNIATMFGIAQSGRKTFGVIGDLTFLHDLGALVNPPMVDLTIFIIDNNGGGIFSTLPQAGQPGFETVFGTPQNQDIARIISGFGHAVFTLDNFAQLPELIELSGLNFVLVKVPNREQNAQLLTAITQSVVSALRIGSNLA